MIVSISRELGAGGLTVGEALAAELNATLFNEATIINALAERGGYSAEYLTKIDECPPSFTTSFMADLARATALVQAMEWRSTEHAVLEEIRALVLEAADRGNVVLIGHGGRKLLGDDAEKHHLFSILLYAGRQWRIDQVARRFGLDREQAAERVRRTDDLRRRFERHFFDADLYDCRQYDLVIDTERVGLPAAVEIAKDAVRAAYAMA
ncbi:MAG: cytidylate kinase-like family protein [Vulcanimicrobiaceae bacterium]